MKYGIFFMKLDLKQMTQDNINNNDNNIDDSCNTSDNNKLY